MCEKGVEKYLFVVLESEVNVVVVIEEDELELVCIKWFNLKLMDSEEVIL